MALILAAAGSACVNRDRLNDRCEWVDSVTVRIDLTEGVQLRHLVEDVQTAEGLGVRFGDRRPGQHTIEARRELGTRCTDSLLAVIASSHGVDTTEIARAREYRNRGVDFALVFLPMFVLLVMAAYGLSFRVLRRIPLHNPWLAAGGILLISLFVVIVWMQAGEVWTGMVEILRLGDSHLGYREFRLPWRRHAVQVGVIGLLLFWLVALFRYRRLRAAAAARASVTTEPR